MNPVVEFRLDHVPVPGARPRVTQRGTYYPALQAKYFTFLKGHLLDKPEFRTGLAVVEVRLLFAMPAYKTSDFPVHRADLDNLAKMPLDMMTKSKDAADQPRYWHDDCLVVGLLAFKRFVHPGEDPHTRVRISLLSETPEAYADRKFNE